MPDLSQEFLHRILKSIPEHQRLAFLKEVMATMEPESRRQLMDPVAAFAPQPVFDEVMARITGMDEAQPVVEPVQPSPEPVKPAVEPEIFPWQRRTRAQTAKVLVWPQPKSNFAKSWPSTPMNAPVKTI